MQVVRRAVVVGAGIVGLSCAWSLQERGVEVCLVDRERPGAGASRQNAGYVSPAMCVPLPEPSILRFGVRAALVPGSPVTFVPGADPRLVRFLAGLVRHCTGGTWERGMAVYRVLNDRVFEAYDRQLDGGVAGEVAEADVLCCTEHAAEGAAVVHHMVSVLTAGQRAEVDLLTGDEARRIEPHLSERVRMAVRIGRQRYLNPSSYVAALSRSVRDRGAEVVEHAAVTEVTRRGGVVAVLGPDVETSADAVVLAAGAWIGALASPHGVRVPVYGGRGYGFTVDCPEPLASPVYFPAVRVAVTPQGAKARLTGIMEFGSPDAPPTARRFESVARGAHGLLVGVDWGSMEDRWMGPRPLTTDGLPLVGGTRTPGVFVAGGHGMWGVTLGPLTGDLLAELVVTGMMPPALAPLEPCR